MAKNEYFRITPENEGFRSKKVVGYRLPDYIVMSLIDGNCENIVFVDDIDGHRYTISVDDWVEYRVYSEVDLWEHVSRSFMSRG